MKVKDLIAQLLGQPMDSEVVLFDGAFSVVTGVQKYTITEIDAEQHDVPRGIYPGTEVTELRLD